MGLPGSCIVCDHEQIREINDLIRKHIPNRRNGDKLMTLSYGNIARRYHLSDETLRRHTINCLGMALPKPPEPEPEPEPETYGGYVAMTDDQAAAMLDAIEKIRRGGSPNQVLIALREWATMWRDIIKNSSTN
jgi:hypothetical protein